MTRGRWLALGLAGALVLAAVYIPHLNVDRLVRRLGDKTPDGTVDVVRGALVILAALVAAEVARRWIQVQPAPKKWSRVGRAVWFTLAALALMAAVYLPHLRAADAVGWLWGAAAETPDKADAVTWTRWVLLALAVVLAAVGVRHAWRELALVVLASLLVVAAAGATNDLLRRLDRPADVPKTEAAFDRGFAVPADKVQRLTRALARDRCVTLILVKKVAPAGTDAEERPSSYEASEYHARLVSAVDAGPAAGPAEVELGRASEAPQFAADLVAASSVFILSTAAAQAATTATTGCR